MHDVLYQGCLYYLFLNLGPVRYWYPETALALAQSLTRHTKPADTTVDINRLHWSYWKAGNVKKDGNLPM
jgi:hypothetical protein